MDFLRVSRWAWEVGSFRPLLRMQGSAGLASCVDVGRRVGFRM